MRKTDFRRMAGGFGGDGVLSERAHQYEYRITGYFIFACIVAALGGSLFGYDLGVSGQFFSQVYDSKIKFETLNSLLIWVFVIHGYQHIL